MKKLITFSFLVCAIAQAQLTTFPPSKITGPGGASVNVSSGSVSLTAAAGGAVNVASGDVYVPTIMNFSTTVSPTLSGSGQAALSYDGTHILLSTNGGAYSIFGAGGLASTDIDTATEFFAIMTGYSGSGNAVRVTSPTLVTPVLGAATATSLDAPTLTSASSITGGASNMTITSGTGNSRTLTLRSTTSGGTATDALVINADQSISLPANILKSSSYMRIQAGSGQPLLLEANGGFPQLALNAGGTVSLSGSGSTFPDFTSGNLITGSAGKGLSIKAGSNTRAGNAVLVGGTVAVANTTIAASDLLVLTRKTAGGTIGDLTYTLSAGVSFTINSVSGTDTSTVTYFIIANP
jgi:hypothetical protein